MERQSTLSVTYLPEHSVDIAGGAVHYLRQQNKRVRLLAERHRT